MNKMLSRILCLPVVVVLTLTILSGCGSGEKRWEYRVLSLPIPRSTVQDRANDLQALMNQLGNEGWDCSIAWPEAIYCKRPR